jgi:ABC-2 type transport system permease protein
MNSTRQVWLVARRELCKRGRSRTFLVSVVLMLATVVVVLVLPTLIEPAGTKQVGLVGPTPAALAVAISHQAQAAGTKAQVHRYDAIAAAERAVRQGRIDVLVAGARRLEWKGRPDQQLKAAVIAAIQQMTVGQRAAAAGIRPDTLAALLAPVRVTNVELGSVAGRSPGDETAVWVMTVLLFICISLFGSMVLTGVVEEKTSRVVEVLLARMPARVLLAGKIDLLAELGVPPAARAPETE